MVTGGAVCSNWACTESVRGEVSDGLPYLDPFLRGLSGAFRPLIDVCGIRPDSV